jgi:RNA polymerase sigma factor (sigma-70 family)
MIAQRSSDRATDQHLLENFVAESDEDAFAALLQRHGPMVFGVCRRLLREIHDAEDAFQATFFVLARRAESIRKKESLASWLHGVAVRVAGKIRLEAARRSRREQCRPAPTDSVNLGDDLTWRELRAVLDEELDRLPARWRASLVLCYLEGQTQDEAAHRLGWSKSTLRRRLERGRRLLKVRLARRGVTLSAGLVATCLSGPAASAAVPATLTAATIRAGLCFAAGMAVSEVGGARAFALAKSVLGGMALAQTKILALCVVVVAFLAGGSLWAYQALAAKQSENLRAQASPLTPPQKDQTQPQPARADPVDQFGDQLPADAVARLGTIRFRHGASPRALTFAPDGLSLASAGIDGVVHIWETTTGKELLHIENERFPDSLGLGSVFGLAYSSTGKTLAGARINQPPCLWDVATGKKIREFGGERQRASWVVFSPDGKNLAFGGGSADPTVRLCEVDTGNELGRFRGNPPFVAQGAFSADGTALAFIDGKTIHLIDIATGQGREVSTQEAEAGQLSSLARSLDGKTLAVARRGQSLIWLVDIAASKPARTIKLTGRRKEVGPLCFMPDGRTLISAHEDGFVRLWDVANGTMRRQFRAHSYTVIALALSPDGSILATSSNSSADHVVRVWDIATGKPLVHPDGPQQGIARVVVSPDSCRVATASWDDAICLWDAYTGKILRHWNLFGPMAFTADNQALVCGGWEDGKVRVLDLTSGKETRQFPAHEKGIRYLALARDGKTLATAGNDQFIRLWDATSGRPIHDFGGKQTSLVYYLTLSTSGKLAATIHDGHVVRLWDTASAKPLREFVETDLVGHLAFSPDGNLLASTLLGNLGGTPLIRLRETATGKEIRQLRGQGDPLDTIAFSPDGRTLIWGGQHRKELYLWEVATGQLRRKFSGHQGQLSSVAFSPNGQWMASGSSDASVLIWPTAGRHDHQQSLGSAELDKLWTDLASNDAASAYQAICTLTGSARLAAGKIAKHLRPVPRADAKQVADVIRRLDSDQFTVREQAEKELEQLGDSAEPALRQCLAGNPSTEVRRRVEHLVERMDGPEQLRRDRALEVLERTGGPEARRLLQSLASGATDARLTREAKEALERLAGH